MLQLCHAPRCPGAYLLMARTDQQQIRQHRDAKGFLDPSLFATDLVLAQPEVCLQLTVDLFHRPPSLVGTDHLSRDPLARLVTRIFVCFGPKLCPSLLSTTVTSPMCRRHRRVLYTQQVLQPVEPGRRGTRMR